jgi:aspartate aminotransferase
VPVTLSRRILSVNPSPTLALNAKAAAMTKAGQHVLSFAVGEPDYATPHEVVEQAITSLRAGRTRYGAAGGGPEIREAISRKLSQENKLTVPPEQIVVGIGAKEILFHTFLTILNDGDEVIIPSPYWVSYGDQIKAAGGKCVELPLPRSLDQCPVSVEAIKAAATPRTVAFCLNSPNNPAGYVLKEKDLRELGQFLLTTDWWIVSDEIYEYMAFDAPHISLLTLFPELAPRFILINGLSKSFAMTGWRVGWGAGPLPVMKLVRSLQSHSSTCLPMFIEDAALVALAAGPGLMKREISVLKSRRDLAAKLMEEVPGISFFRPEGAFYIFIDVREGLTRARSLPARTSMALSEWLLVEHKLAFVPGEAFGAPGFLRMSYATSEDTIRQGTARLAEALAKQGMNS